MESDQATGHWYQGHGYWDFENGAPKSTSDDNQQQARQFATMIWKGVNFAPGTTFKVGFGIKCGHALAWYCPTNKKADAKTDFPMDMNKRGAPKNDGKDFNQYTKEYQENVCKGDGSCVDPSFQCTKDGYDACYNKMAAKAHNEKRKLHCAPTKYEVDTTMAKNMQKLLNEKQAATDAAKRDPAYKDCLENFYTAPTGTSEADVMNKNLATDAWYAMKSKYNFGTGVGTPPAEADVFTRIVWEVAAGKIAFARRGKYVMAWYCPSGKAGINVGDAAAYKAAVKPDTCPKTCEDDVAGDGYRKCYQPLGLAAHNAKRAIHKVPALVLDYDVAKRA